MYSRPNGKRPTFFVIGYRDQPLEPLSLKIEPYQPPGWPSQPLQNVKAGKSINDRFPTSN